VDTSLALMEAGADVNAQSGEGNSALTYAAYSGSRVLVEAMLEQAKDPKACNKLGMSAADVADQQGHHEVGKLLRGDETG
jgi:ankyrin repeat protein